MRIVASHWKLTMTNGEHHRSWFSYNYERSLKNSTSTILGSADIWSKLERRKGLSGSLMSWPKKKKLSFWSVVVFYSTQQPMIHCSIGSWYMRKKGFYMMTSSVVGLRSSKHFPKANLQQRSRSLFGGLMPVWSTTAFWIPEKPLHLRSMLSKSMRCTPNWKPALVNNNMDPVLLTTMPNHTLHSQIFKSWMNWVTYKVLSHLPCSPELSPTDYFFKYLNNSLQDKSFHNQQEAENAFKEFVEIWSTIFILQE